MPKSPFDTFDSKETTKSVVCFTVYVYDKMTDFQIFGFHKTPKSKDLENDILIFLQMKKLITF